MATKLSSNLSLRLNSEMTDDILFNFRKLDELGSIFQVNPRGDALLRSRTNVVIEAAAPSIGGSGSGGQVTIGAADNLLEEFKVFADSIDFGGASIENLSVSWDDITDFSMASVLDIPDFNAQVSAQSSVNLNTQHRGRTDNPHGVTAAQVGTYESSTIDSLLAPKATTAALTAHTGASTGVHGVTGSVVGTSDTQTLTNKSISASLNSITNLNQNSFSPATVFPRSFINLENSVALSDLTTSFVLPWTKVSKTGSSISSIESRSHTQLTDIGANTHAQIDTHISAGIAHGISSAFVGVSDVQVLSGKTIDAENNTITNLTNLSLAEDAAISGTKIDPNFGGQEVLTLDAYAWEEGGYKTRLLAAQAGQTQNLEFQMPSSDGAEGQVLSTNGSGRFGWTSVLGSSLANNRVDIGNGDDERAATNTAALGDILASTTDGLTIKDEVITDVNIDPNAAISLTKLEALNPSLALQSSLSGGIEESAVTSTELSYLSGVTSGIQDQIDDKQDELDFANLSSTAPLSGGGTGVLVGDTNVTLSMTQSSTSVDGWLSSTDWNTFNGKQDSDAELDGLSALTGIGLVVRSAEETYVTRTLTGGTAITVTEGDGEITNPSVDLDIDSLLTDTVEVTDVVALSKDGDHFKATVQDIVDLAAGDSIAAFSWVTGDGATKIVTHTFNTRNVMVELMDATAHETIYVDSVSRTGDNEITLTASEAPPAGGWTILVRN